MKPFFSELQIVTTIIRMNVTFFTSRQITARSTQRAQS